MKEIMMIRIDHLEPHPDAQAYGASRGVSDEQECFSALKYDISKAGILSPLDVIASGEKGRWLVIDGCGRLASARTLEIKEIPCVDAGEIQDVRVYAVSKNAMRRTLTSGERVMRFVDLHQREVAEAWKAGSEHDSDAEKSGRGKGGGGARDTTLSSRSISERLGCSNKDALAGMQIAACIEFGLRPKRDDATGVQKLVPVEGEKERAAVIAAKAAVMAGSAGIRKWPAAYAGKVAVDKVRGKSETDYAALADRSSIGLTNASRHWGEANWNADISKKKVMNQLTMMIDSLVVCHGVDFFSRVIKDRWTPDMINALIKGIKA